MEKRKYFVQGMDCVDCAQKVEKGVRRLEGVANVELNFMTTAMLVEGTVEEESLYERVEALGYKLAPASAAPARKPAERFLPGFIHYIFSERETRLAMLGGALVILSYGLSGFGLQSDWIVALQIGALVLAGYPVVGDAIRNLAINHDLNMNFLMTVAAIGAVIIGEIPEVAGMIFLFAIAEALEGYTNDRARRSIGDLADLAPPQALRLNGGRREVVPVEQLLIGDHILVLAGERVPMDGQVVAGESDVNQAPITGESMPVDKVAGDALYAGSVNGSGVLEVEITHSVADNTLSRIIGMVEKAQSVRAPIQNFVDRFAHYYTPAMMVVALLVAVVPPLFFGQPWLNLADGTRGWIYRGLAMLVIGCPCALVVSAPVTIVSSIAAAARQGVLFKGGAYLEGLNKVKVVAFDKTGTLTRGEPVVTISRSVDCPDGASCSACDDVLGLAYSLEQRSSHPLALAVVQAAEQRGVIDRYPLAERITALKGKGLQGQVNGQVVTVGNHRLFDEAYPHAQQVCQWVELAEASGHTTMLVSDGKRVRGYLAMRDRLREESAAVVQELQGMGMKTALLSGDNATAAQAVGKELGIEIVKAELLPENKVESIQALEKEYGPVAMLGDGINDAPALATATVGIAMGGAGTAQAMELADVVLMADGLQKLPFAFSLANFSHQVILQNIIFSLVTKLIFILLAGFGLATMWMAVLADTGMALLVTLNGMRPLAFRGSSSGEPPITQH